MKAIPAFPFGTRSVRPHLIFSKIKFGWHLETSIYAPSQIEAIKAFRDRTGKNHLKLKAKRV